MTWKSQITYLNFKLSAGSTCLRAGPCSTDQTLLAKLSEQRVSPESVELALICMNISVLQSPPVNVERIRLSPYFFVCLFGHSSPQVKIDRGNPSFS